MTLNGAQRVVLSVALGAAVVVVGVAVQEWWWGDGFGEGGWFNYAPNNGVIYSPVGQPSTGARAAVWLVLVAVWAAASLWLFRSRAASSTTSDA